jgi:hypothetical protein
VEKNIASAALNAAGFVAAFAGAFTQGSHG